MCKGKIFHLKRSLLDFSRQGCHENFFMGFVHLICVNNAPLHGSMGNEQEGLWTVGGVGTEDRWEHHELN